MHDWTGTYCVVTAGMCRRDELCRVSDEDKPRLLCCSADCVTLSEPAKAKAGRPCKAPGPPPAQSGTLSEGNKYKNKFSKGQYLRSCICLTRLCGHLTTQKKRFCCCRISVCILCIGDRHFNLKFFLITITLLLMVPFSLIKTQYFIQYCTRYIIAQTRNFTTASVSNASLIALPILQLWPSRT